MKIKNKIVVLFTVLIMCISCNKVTARAIENVVDILSFNDFHGNAIEQDKNVGAAKLTGVIKKYEEKENPNYGVIVVSGGDIFQGSAISNLTEGQPEIDMIKAMKLQVSAVGNHEFDWGRQNIEKWQKEGNFKFLAANIIDKNTKETAKFVEPYKLIEKNGVKIAFIGLTTKDTVTSTKAENIEGLEFADYNETLNKYIKIVKKKGADAVIAVTHCDAYKDSNNSEITGEVAEIAKGKVEGLDAIISAHSHKFICETVNNIPIVQAGFNGRGISKLSLKFDKNKLIGITPETIKFEGKESNLPIDEEVNDKVNKLQEKMKWILNDPVTVIDDRLNNEDRYSNLTDLGVKVSETIRLAVGTEIAITNGGGIRRSLEKGEVKAKDMYEILPFDSYIETMKVSGAELKKIIQHGINPEEMGWIQFSGIKVYCNPDTFEINDITLLNGENIKENEYYTLAANDFMVTGGDGYDFSKVMDLKNTNLCIRDCVMNYWRKNGVPEGETKLLLKGKAPNMKSKDNFNIKILGAMILFVISGIILSSANKNKIYN